MIPSSIKRSSGPLFGLPSPLLILVVSSYLTTGPLSFSFASAQSSDVECFFPNGTAAPDDVQSCGAGGSDTAHSHCCSRGWACLNNGLCIAAGQDPENLADATIFQGACTDRTWASPDCPRYCTDPEEIDRLGEPQPIDACRGSTSIFRCVLGDEDADCDDDDDEVFGFPGTPTILTTIGSSPTSSSSSSSTGTGSPRSQTSGSSNPTGTPSAGEDGSGSDGGNNNNNDNNDGGANNTALTVGISVGIGLAVFGISMAVIFFILWRRRVRKSKADDAKAEEEAAEKRLSDIGGASSWSPSPAYSASGTNSNELPLTLSREVKEAPPDAMRLEAPEGDQRVGRSEVPMNEVKPEMPVLEGVQGRHELGGVEVPRTPVSAAVSPVGTMTPVEGKKDGEGSKGESEAAAAKDVSPVVEEATIVGKEESKGEGDKNAEEEKKDGRGGGSEGK